jgi:hypothetical protein
MQKITADLSEIPCPFGDRPHGARVETGPLQINNDWPGVFIRGDNAMYDAMQCRQAHARLKKLLEETVDIPMADWMLLSFLENHAKLLGSSRV